MPIGPDSASTRYQILIVFKSFHSGERIKIFADSVAGFTGYVWTEGASAKNSLRIQMYPVTRGRGISVRRMLN